jgi:hypothetical protein
MSDNEKYEGPESPGEEKQEAVFDVPSENLSEFFGTSTVKDFPTIDVVYADNSAYNKTQTRGV